MHRFAMPPDERFDHGRYAHPEIWIAIPEFRTDAARRCICARETVEKDTFGSASCGRAITCVAVARNAPGPLRQAGADDASGCVERGRARRVWRGRGGKGRVI